MLTDPAPEHFDTSGIKKAQEFVDRTTGQGLCYAINLMPEKFAHAEGSSVLTIVIGERLHRACTAV
jgi:hypothetical protein